MSQLRCLWLGWLLCVFMHLPAISNRMNFVVRLPVRKTVNVRTYIETLLARCLINRLWECHKICNFGAVADTDELITFQGQKVKVTARPNAPFQRRHTDRRFGVKDGPVFPCCEFGCKHQCSQLSGITTRAAWLPIMLPLNNLPPNMTADSLR